MKIVELDAGQQLGEDWNAPRQIREVIVSAKRQQQNEDCIRIGKEPCSCCGDYDELIGYYVMATEVLGWDAIGIEIPREQLLGVIFLDFDDPPIPEELHGRWMGVRGRF